MLLFVRLWVCFPAFSVCNGFSGVLALLWLFVGLTRVGFLSSSGFCYTVSFFVFSLVVFWGWLLRLGLRGFLIVGLI